MNIISYVMATFAIIGGIDYILGNKFKLGKEFEKGILLLGNLMLSMVGMLVLTPLFAKLLQPLTSNMNFLDPSIIPALFFANDMGGASMSTMVANNAIIGKFNALVVSSMMGVSFSFTLPYALGVVKKQNHNPMFLGFLCGIITIPFGCLVGGIILGISLLMILLNLLPIILLCIIIAFGLIKAPNFSLKIFSILGVFIKIIITIGLIIGVFEMATGLDVVPYTSTIEEAGIIILKIACILAGAFPLVCVLSKILKKPLSFLGNKLKINPISAIGLLSTIASSAPTFGLFDEMNEKGIVLNSAFAISGSFVIGSHLAFTLAYSEDCVLAVVIGKLVAGLLAVVVANLIFSRKSKKESYLNERI